MRVWDKSRPPRGPFTLSRDSPLAQGLVAWYPLGMASGQFVPDGAGIYPLDTAAGGPSITLAPDGAPALAFVGASSQQIHNSINIPALAVLFTFDGAFTAIGVSTYQTPFCIGNPGTSTSILQIYVNTGNCAIYYNGATTWNSTLSAVSANTWYRVTHVEYSSSSREAYLNGVSKATNSSSITPASLQQIVLGSYRYNGIYDIYFTGQVAEPALWNRALSASEVALRSDPGRRFELWYPLRSRKWFTGGAGAGAYSESIFESLTGTDAATALASFQSAAADSLTGIDASTGSAGGAQMSSESATLTDLGSAAAAFQAALAEPLTATDVQAAAAAFLAAATGSLTVTDASDWLSGQFGTAAESATLADAAAVSAVAWHTAMLESGTLSDAQTAAAAFLAAQTEIPALSDLQAAAAAYLAALADTGSLSDAQSAAKGLSAGVAEVAAAADAQDVTGGATDSIAQFVAFVDSADVLAALQGAVVG